MKKVSNLIFIMLLSCFSFSSVTAANNDNALKVMISMDKLTFENDEPVLLYVNIKNKSDERKTFSIYDSYITFRPYVYGMDGREAETLVDYRLSSKSMSDAVKAQSPRTIELSKNEIFTYIIDLNNIYKIYPETQYRVKALFSPDIYDKSLVSDNQLNFKCLSGAGSIKDNRISRIERYVSPQRTLTPSEVVMLFLKAEKDRDWGNYFKFIDIELFISGYPDYVRVYNNAASKNDIEQKENIIHKFADFLKTERSDYIITYKVLSEIKKNDNNIYVEALIKRFASINPSVYKYRYLLEKYENLWLITDVEVTVSKGQKI